MLHTEPTEQQKEGIKKADEERAKLVAAVQEKWRLKPEQKKKRK